MMKKFVRRSVFALVVGVLGVAAAGTAHADDTTGTDPCPPHRLCTVSTGDSSMTSMVTVLQVLMVVAGM